MSDRQQAIICDPQTSGGLLISLNQNSLGDFHKICAEFNLNLQPIGRMKLQDKKKIEIS